MNRVYQLSGCGVYIHVPFCRSKCAYCDFPSYAGIDELQQQYVAALCKEIAAADAAEVRTIFFGGGTPTSLPAEELSKILESLKSKFRLTEDAEVTVEMNPFTGSRDYANALKAMGINRVSVGVQSFSAELLGRVGRQAEPEQAVETVENLRSAGIDNISLDLLYAMPEQSLEELKQDLDKLLDLQPEHLSIYQLTNYEGTALHKQVSGGGLVMASEEQEQKMYKLIEQKMQTAGFVHYEVSNYCRDGKESRHNLGYWLGLPFIGFGSAAHSFYGGIRGSNIGDPAKYIEKMEAGKQPFMAEVKAIDEKIAGQDRLAEYLLMRLRLINSMAKFGHMDALLNLNSRELLIRQLKKLEQTGFVQLFAAGFSLTPSGLMMLDSVLIDLMEVK